MIRGFFPVGFILRMLNMKKISALAFLLFTSVGVSAAEWVNNEKIEALFSEAEVTGTFVLYDAAEDKLIGFNKSRAETRFFPASTFKIPNTLIGLSVGAVKNVDEVLPYGGAPQPFPSWEKDMSLRDAITISNVPIYKELARRITLEKMRSNLAAIDYGNNDIGGVVDNFWLVGPLTISAVEQTNFLARLAGKKLPLPESIHEATHEIVLLEKTDSWSLYGKTGWADAPDPDIGWWVGWVVKGDKVYSFALNIDVQNDTDAPKRIPLGKESLKILGVL
jgi:beta-lactamase class D